MFRLVITSRHYQIECRTNHRKLFHFLLYSSNSGHLNIIVHHHTVTGTCCQCMSHNTSPILYQIEITHLKCGLSRQFSTFGRLLRTCNRVWASFNGWIFISMAISRFLMVSSILEISFNTWQMNMRVKCERTHNIQ